MMDSLLMKPTSNWFFAFSALVFATITVLGMILFNMSHNPEPVRRVPTQREANARTLLDLYGQDWYGPGCGQRRCE